MKLLNTIWIVIILVFAGGQTAYAQEINKAVNSSKALRLLEEIEHTNNEMKIKNEERSKRTVCSKTPINRFFRAGEDTETLHCRARLHQGEGIRKKGFSVEKECYVKSFLRQRNIAKQRFSSCFG